MFADEELVMELLINAGQARSDAMEAIRCAGQKDWQGATKLMASSESACLQAHKIQTALISQDEGCGKIYFIKKRAPCLIFSPVRYLEEITTLLRISYEYKDA